MIIGLAQGAGGGGGGGTAGGLAYKTVTITYFMFYCKEFYNLLGEVIFFDFSWVQDLLHTEFESTSNFIS